MHFIKRWDCGCVHSQCRCPGPKTVLVLAGPCPVHATQAVPQADGDSND